MFLELPTPFSQPPEICSHNFKIQQLHQQTTNIVGKMIEANKRKKKSGSESQFPGKLHNMMGYVEREGLEHVISWVINGRGFMIHDPEKLVKILPLFFAQTKYRSFRRQLNMWHFERIMSGPHKGAFMHPYFVRDNQELCACMSRQIFVKSRTCERQTSSKSIQSRDSTSSFDSTSQFILPMMVSPSNSGSCTPTLDSSAQNSLPSNPIGFFPQQQDGFSKAPLLCRSDDIQYSFDEVNKGDYSKSYALSGVGPLLPGKSTSGQANPIDPIDELPSLDALLEPNPFKEDSALDLHFELNEDPLDAFGGRCFFVVGTKNN